MTNDAKHSSRNTQANIGRLLRRKRLRVHPKPHRLSQMVAAILVSASAPAFALPTGGTPVAGNVAINTPNAQTMNVVQGSNKAIVNWNGFSIGRGESVNFAQPSSSAVILNRVIGGDLSVILGRLTANGHVFLINPMGVLFGHGGQVNAQGLVASTLAISNEDFLAGRYVFSNSGGAGSVVNQGNITVGGIAALLGPQVRNDGVINARMGAVALGAGDRVTLDFNGDGLLRFSVDAAAVKANVTNAGTIDAEGGNVIMSARAAGALMDTVLNMNGVVRATSIVERNGKIVLDGGPSGIVSVTGKLDASGHSAGATGGAVSVLGDKVGLFDGTRIDASGDRGGGTVLVGGNWQGKGPEQNASSTYVGKDVTISASAGSAGDGGKVVVWANDATRFFGSIDARGGTGGGNGGNVEVSGKTWLDFQGHSDTRAPIGRTGTLLLDPTDITISTAVTAGGNCAGATCFNLTGNPDTANLNVATLISVLGSNNVIVNTDSTGTGANGGRIAVNAPVSWDSAFSLTLTADENIVASGANSIINSGTGNINLNAVNVTIGSSLGTAGTLTVNVSGATSTIGGVIQTGSLTKQGTGTLELNGASANTYAGATTVSEGTLIASKAGALGTTAAGTSVTSGATLEINNVDIGTEALSLAGTGDGGIGALVGTGAGAIAGGAITLTANARVGGTGTLALNGAIDGAFALGKSGAGTVVLGGLNTYSGDTAINQGTLSTAGTERIPNASAVSIASGATLNLGGDETIESITGAAGSTLTLGGALTTGSAASTALASDIGGAGSLTKVGAGTLTLSGANTYSGGTVINQGELSVNADARLGNAAGGITFGGGTLAVTAGFTTTRPITLGGAGTLDVAAGETLTHNAVIGGTGSLNKVGNGVLVLQGANIYTGATTVNAGTLNASNASALGTTAAGTSVASGATLEIDNVDIGTEALSLAGIGVGGNGALVGTGAGAIAGGAITLTANARVGGTGTLALNGAIGGTFALGKSGAGTVVLAGLNTYTGATNANVGTLRASNTSALGTTAAGTNVASGATLEIDNVDIGTEALSLEGIGVGGIGALVGTGAGAIAGGAITLTANARVGGAGTLALNGAIGGAFALTKTGAGTVVLGGLNTYSGDTAINQGTLSTAGTERIPNASAVSIASGATLNLGGDETIESITGAAGSTLTLGGALTTGSAASTALASDIGGAGSLTKVGAGTLTLSGANTYSGGTVINQGELSVNADARLGNAAGGITFGGGTLAVTAGFTTTRPITLGGAGTLDVAAGETLTHNAVIGGTGSLNKVGNGVLVLQGANIYTGATTVNAGTLNASNASALGTTAAGTSVASGATLEIDNVDIGTEALSLAGIGVGGNGALVGTGAGAIAGGAITLTANARVGGTGTLALNGAIGGTFALGKSGAGTVVLAGLNTYTGATNANVGTLRASNTSALGTTAAGTNVASGATLEIDNVDIGTEALSLEGIGVGGIGALVGTGAGAMAGGAITLTADTTVGGTGTLALNGAIGGAFALTKTGAGMVVLGGLNTYSGDTAINQGTLSTAGTERIPNASAVSIASGATLNLGGDETIDSITGAAGSTLTLGGALTTGSAASTPLASDIGGVGSLTKVGAGTLTLSGNNAYTGATNVNAGTLTASSASALGTTAAGTTVASGATLAINNVDIGAEPLSIAGNGVGGNGALVGTGAGAVSSGTIDLPVDARVGAPAGTDVLTLSGPIGGAGGLTKVGAGTVILSGSNTYNGTTTVSGGTLQVNSASALGATAAGTTVQNPATLAILGGTTLDAETITINGPGVAAAGALIALPGTGDAVLTAPVLVATNSSIGGSGVLVLNAALDTTPANDVTKVGTGVLRLTQPSIGSGNLILSQGSLGIVNATSLLANTVIETGTGIDLFNLNVDNTRNFELRGGTLTGSGSSSIAGNVVLSGATPGFIGTPSPTVTTDMLTINGLVSGTQGFRKIGGGTLVLANAVNTYSGRTVLEQGTLRISADRQLGTVPSPAAVNIEFSGGTLETTAGFALDQNRSIQVNPAGGTIDVDAGTTLTYTGTFSSAGTLNKADTGTLVLGGNYASGSLVLNAGTTSVTGATGLPPGGTTVNGGATLELNNAALGAGIPITLVGGTLTGAGTASSAGAIALGADSNVGGGGTLTLSGVVSGAGGLNKVDAGTLVLSGANTYAGTTNVNAGTLRASSANALGGTGAGTTVASGATLAVSGVDLALGEAITLNGGALVSEGTTSRVGAVTLGADSVIGGSGAFTVGSVTGGANRLTIVSTAGSVVLAGDVTAGAINSAANPVTIQFHGDSSTIGGEGLFLNSGLVTFGNNATDAISFAGDVTHTGAPTTIVGTLGGANVILRGGGTPIALSGTINGTGTTTLGTFTLGANSTITGATGVIVDTGQINGEGRTLTVSSSGGSVDLGKPIGGGSTLTGLTVSSIGTTVLPSGTVTGNANVVSGGDITQSGPLTVTGSSTIGSNAGTATLTQVSNSLHGAGGALTLAGNASSVVNAGNTTLVLAGSGSHAVTAGNNLAVSGAAGSLTTSSNGLTFGATTLSGNLSSTAIAPVTQTGALSVGGATTIATASTSNIALTNAANTFTGPVSLSGNQLSVRAAGNLVLGNWTSSNTNTINTTLAAASETAATTESAKAAMSFEATGTIIQSAGALLNLASNKSIVIKAGDNVGGLTEATGIKFPTTVDFDVRNLIVFASIPSTRTARLFGRISAVDPTVFAVTPSTASTLGEILYNEGLTIPTAVSNVAGEVVGGVTSQIASQVESAFKPGRIDQVINNAFTPDLSVSPPPVFNRILGAREPVVEGAAPEDEAKKRR